MRRVWWPSATEISHDQKSYEVYYRAELKQLTNKAQQSEKMKRTTHDAQAVSRGFVDLFLISSVPLQNHGNYVRSVNF